MPPVERFVCRFAAEPSQEALPHGAWAQTLQAEFLSACLRIDSEGQDLGEARELRYFPDRTWNGRTYVPVTARTTTELELFGFVSFVPPDADEHGSEASAFESSADFTDETAERNPDWRIDLCEEVVGRWRGEGGRTADMTLVWGVPLLAAARVATAELAGLAVDQCPLVEDRFTLIAPDNFRVGLPRREAVGRRRARARVRVALRRRRRGRRHGLDGLERDPEDGPAADAPTRARNDRRGAALRSAGMKRLIPLVAAGALLAAAPAAHAAVDLSGGKTRLTLDKGTASALAARREGRPDRARPAKGRHVTFPITGGVDRPRERRRHHRASRRPAPVRGRHARHAEELQRRRRPEDHPVGEARHGRGDDPRPHRHAQGDALAASARTSRA